MQRTTCLVICLLLLVTLSAVSETRNLSGPADPVPPKAEQPGGDTPPAYLASEEDLPRLAEEFGLDDEALERLERAHHHLVEHQAAPKPDPVLTNGPVFEGWPKPQAVLVFTGEQMGYLEPCGCAGLENQKGGLKRRHTFARTLRETWGWPVAFFDAGEQVRYFGPQAQIKHRHSIESLIEIGYQAVGFGPRDLRTDLLGLAINLEEDENPFTCANVGLLDFDSGFSKNWRVIEVGEDDSPVRVGVTHVLASQALGELAPSDDLVTLSAEEALEALGPTIKQAACDQNVLMVYGDEQEAQQLAQRFDWFDWVVITRGADEPPSQPLKIDGTKRGGGATLIEVGHKGMYAVAVGLFRKTEEASQPQQEFAALYQKVPFDHRWADSPAMHERLVRYQEELRTLDWEGLSLKPAPHPTGRDFAGSGVCGDCHTAAWEVFEQTPHFHTSETLVALSPARHFDPECIACHATGWEPQKYFPFAKGWKSYRDTPEMHGQGCENCHGPAARHAAVEYGDIEVDEEEELALRQALHLEIQENEGNMPGQLMNDTTRAVNNCLGCHDLDNSPDFDFQEYWPAVAHEGVD